MNILYHCSILLIILLIQVFVSCLITDWVKLFLCDISLVSGIIGGSDTNTSSNVVSSSTSISTTRVITTEDPVSLDLVTIVDNDDTNTSSYRVGSSASISSTKIITSKDSDIFNLATISDNNIDVADPTLASMNGTITIRY